MEIMVSISCLVYNHGKYLRKTLEGFVNQKTNFKYEIVIHDDASTDNSAEIIKEYCDKYPDMFVPIFQTENQYSKGVAISKKFIHPKYRGKYVAFCEGDDYWCNENKLQMQVDYMEQHPDCSMCVHDTLRITGEGESLHQYVNGSRRNQDYSAKDIIKADGGGLFQTSSFLTKTEIIRERPSKYNVHGVGDYPMAIYAGVSGYVHYIGQVMSCYRVGHTGSWGTKTHTNKQFLVEHYSKSYEDLTRMDRETNYKYKYAFEVPRGTRLWILYKEEYGFGKLLSKPKDLILVLKSLKYRTIKKIKSYIYNRIDYGQV